MSSFELSSSQVQALQLMRENFLGLTDNSDNFVLDDSTFLRYLRARNFNFEQSSAMLYATLDWRKSFGLSELFNGWKDVIMTENSTGKTYIRGLSRLGHAICYMKPRLENTKDHDGNLKHTVYNMEKATEVMRLGSSSAEKIILLIDYAGYSISNSPSMKTSLAVLSILQNHYPERLQRAYMINTSWIFNSSWSLISPFVDAITRDKIRFINGNAQDLRQLLEIDIDPKVLESELGGDDIRPFNSKFYLEAPFCYDYYSALELSTDISLKSDATTEASESSASIVN